MASKTKRGTKARAPLSRERILRTAIMLVDEGGLASLSMRKLGQTLGVEAMSLYRHVANRDEILNGIVDIVLGEIYVPAKESDWRMAMRQRAISTHQVLLRHPWASSLLESRASPSPLGLRYADALIGNLLNAGFSTALTYRAMLMTDSYVYGFALQEANWVYDAEELPDVLENVRLQVPADMYPNVAAIIGYLLESSATRAGPGKKGPPDFSSEFEFGLDLILDGLARLRDAQAGTAPRTTP